MKRLSLTTLLTPLLLLTGCGGGELDNLEFERISVSREVAIDKSEGAPRCTVDLQMDFLGEQYGEVAKAINSAVVNKVFYLENLSMKEAADSFANKYCRDYVKNYAPLYREDKADKKKLAWYEYQYKVSTEVSQERKGVLTYFINLEYYEGGAHGISQQLSMNFDKATGRQMALADIFVPGYEQRLNELLLEALQEKTGTKNLDELHEEGYLYSCIRELQEYARGQQDNLKSQHQDFLFVSPTGRSIVTAKDVNVFLKTICEKYMVKDAAGAAFGKVSQSKPVEAAKEAAEAVYEKVSQSKPVEAAKEAAEAAYEKVSQSKAVGAAKEAAEAAYEKVAQSKAMEKVKSYLGKDKENKE